MIFFHIYIKYFNDYYCNKSLFINLSQKYHVCIVERFFLSFVIFFSKLFIINKVGKNINLKKKLEKNKDIYVFLG